MLIEAPRLCSACCHASYERGLRVYYCVVHVRRVCEPPSRVRSSPSRDIALQGNCTTNIRHFVRTWAQLRPRQCVLITDEDILAPTRAEAPHHLWWDNIYVVMRPNPRGEHIVPLIWGIPGNKLWAINSTFEGDLTNSSAIAAVLGSNVYGGGAQRSNAHIARCSSTCV